MKILALDLGTHTGWASWDGARRESGVQVFDVKRGESPGMRFIRFNRWLHETLNAVKPELIVYEQAWGNMRSGTAAEVALGLATRVQEACALHKIEHQPIHGTTLKKWTAGSGNAGKPQMISAVNERFGPPFITDDNEADARALLEYAKVNVAFTEAQS
jgi:Holliday junction resolvasome RuvABC endonuclease subunit